MQADGLLVFNVSPQGQADAHVFYRTLLDLMRQLPGVNSVSVAQERPGSGWSNNNDGFPLDGVRKEGEMLRTNSVGPGFFRTVGVPILVGRDIAESDARGTQFVVLVNETFVKNYLTGTNPLGHFLGDDKFRFNIVGVVRDSKYTSVNEEPTPMAYFACMQFPNLGPMSIEVRARGDAMALLPEVRKALASLYPNVPLEKPMTQQQQFEESYAKQRMFGAMGGFSGVPLSFFAARPLKSMLYQISPLDPVSFALAIAAMIVVSVGAALLPARRAASIDPNLALRSE